MTEMKKSKVWLAAAASTSCCDHGVDIAATCPRCDAMLHLSALVPLVLGAVVAVVAVLIGLGK